jgi:hypothetical protein
MQEEPGNVSDDTIKDDETRGETSQTGFASAEIRRNPEQPTADTDDSGRGDGAQETTISPGVGDTSEDLIDRVDDEK